MSLVAITKEQAKTGRFFDARGATTQAIIRCKEPTMLICGPVGTGKTFAALERIRACAMKYPGMRAILLRKVRKWMTQSALVTWEERVMVKSVMVPDKIQRSNRSEYRFKNGSVIAVDGLDDPQMVMSSDWDMAFILEATEVPSTTVEAVQTRLRHGHMPYQQLIMDCNPSFPNHWLKRQIDASELPSNIGADGRPLNGFKHIPMKLTDNPYFYDQQRGQWTRNGREYLDRLLKNITGSRKARLLDGLWAQADGVVFEEWDGSHVIPAFRIPLDWRRYLSIDWGFIHPAVVQWWAEDSDGRLYLYREIYSTGKLVEDLARWVVRESAGEPPFEAVICDHDREDRETFERHSGLATIPAQKDVYNGIQGVKARLRDAGDGKPRLFVLQGALCHDPDQALQDAGKPTSTEAAMLGYVWKPSLTNAKEEPLKENDDGPDAMRYMARHLDSHPIQEDDIPTSEATRKPFQSW